MIPALQQMLQAKSITEKQLANLVIGAFFFRCQSCGHLTVASSKKTTEIKLSNIRFFMDKRKSSAQHERHSFDTERSRCGNHYISTLEE